MTKGFAFAGLLLFICCAVIAQSSQDPVSRAGANDVTGLVLDNSNVPDGVGILRGEEVQVLKPNQQDGINKPQTMTPDPATRVAPQPSYATANVTTVALPNGGELQFKVPSELDNEPAFIDTGDPVKDKENYVKVLNDYFGVQVVEDPQ